MREGLKPEMMKCFTRDSRLGDGTEELENRVNKWLVDHEGAITIVERNVSMSRGSESERAVSKLIVIWYRLKE